jgi:hypothetical protein
MYYNITSLDIMCNNMYIVIMYTTFIKNIPSFKHFAVFPLISINNARNKCRLAKVRLILNTFDIPKQTSSPPVF